MFVGKLVKRGKVHGAKFSPEMVIVPRAYCGKFISESKNFKRGTVHDVNCSLCLKAIES